MKKNIDFEYLNKLYYAETPIDLSIEDHEKIISFILNNQKDIPNYESKIHSYLQHYFLGSTDTNIITWFHAFTSTLLDSFETLDNDYVYLFTDFLICHDKTTFISILNKTRSFYIFSNSFELFNYTQSEKDIIVSFFDFGEKQIIDYTNDYGLKRDIFDIFGIIPSLLVLNFDKKKIQIFKFLLRNFDKFSIEQQANICVHSFNKANKDLYEELFTSLPHINNNIIHYLNNKVKNYNKTDCLNNQMKNYNETCFLNFALPIKEKINLSLNIQYF